MISRDPVIQCLLSATEGDNNSGYTAEWGAMRHGSENSDLDAVGLEKQNRPVTLSYHLP